MLITVKQHHIATTVKMLFGMELIYFTLFYTHTGISSKVLFRIWFTFLSELKYVFVNSYLYAVGLAL